MEGEQIKSWETNERWARHVAEAKARGYSCGVTEVSEKAPAPKPTNSSVTKLEKAKVQCSELGFTAGTEKHGECVLKLMDTTQTTSGNKCASYIEKSTPEDVRSLADALLKGGVSAYQQNRVLYIDQQVVGIELPDGEVVGCDPR